MTATSQRERDWVTEPRERECGKMQSESYKDVEYCCRDQEKRGSGRWAGKSDKCKKDITI